jgi:class 3 adenylate cyclase
LGSSTPTDTSLTTLLAVHLEKPIDLVWMRGIVQEMLEAHRGVPAIAEQTNVLATFDGPGRAIRCGLAVAEHTETAGLHVSIGLHTAEVARRGAYVFGDGVRVAQSVADRAASGEVWVTSTVRDLTAGSGLTFQPRIVLDEPWLGRTLELDAVT